MSLAAGDLRAYLRLIAGWIWHEQDDAFGFGLSLQEETLTEILLLKMARDLGPVGLDVQMFKKPEEGQNGADWEWYFEGPNCSAGFRIQAKILKHNKASPGEYKQLGLPKGQTQNLIDEAKKHRFNPIYIFYNHPCVLDHDLFGPSVQPDWFGRSCWGCSVATAEFVRTVPNKKLATVIKGSRPWHQFFRLGKTCGTAIAVQQMPGEQEFQEDPQRPEWADALRELRDADQGLRDERMEGLLAHRKLAGVALFSSWPKG